MITSFFVQQSAIVWVVISTKLTTGARRVDPLLSPIETNFDHNHAVLWKQQQDDGDGGRPTAAASSPPRTSAAMSRARRFYGPSAEEEFIVTDPRTCMEVHNISAAFAKKNSRY
jgi:hypothetical protein